MKTAIGWKLYYGDGTIVSSLQRSWPEAPSDNIQVLSVYFAETYRIHRDGEWHKEHYRDMYFGKDYYWQFGNGQVAQVPKGAEVKLGRELESNEWRKLYERARKDVVWL